MSEKSVGGCFGCTHADPVFCLTRAKVNCAKKGEVEEKFSGCNDREQLKVNFQEEREIDFRDIRPRGSLINRNVRNFSILKSLEEIDKIASQIRDIRDVR